MKLAVLVRTDLEMGKGKIASQVGHAAVEAFISSKQSIRDPWIKTGMKKIVLRVKGFDELKRYKQKADKEKLLTCLVKDAGKTQLKKPEITCLAIGPDQEEKIDKVTKDLKLL